MPFLSPSQWHGTHFYILIHFCLKCGFDSRRPDSGQVVVPWHVKEMYITTLAASRDSAPPERRRMTNKGLFGRQLPDDSTLENMRKSELIELLHIAEHNHSVLVEAYNNVVINSRCNSCLLVENNRQLREKLAAGA